MPTSWSQRRERSCTIWWWPRAATSSKIDAGNSPLYPNASWESKFWALCNVFKRFFSKLMGSPYWPVSSHAGDWLSPCWVRHLPSAAFTPPDCLLNILQVILIQEAPVWMKMHTHTHTHLLCACKCFPKLTAKHPIGHRHSQQKKKKNLHYREICIQSLSLFLSVYLSSFFFSFSLFLSLAHPVFQHYEWTMSAMYAIKLPNTVCVCLGVERRDSSHQLKFSFCTALVDKGDKMLSCGPFKVIILMQSSLKGRKNSQVQIWASF